MVAIRNIIETTCQATNRRLTIIRGKRSIIEEMIYSIIILVHVLVLCLSCEFNNRFLAPELRHYACISQLLSIRSTAINNKVQFFQYAPYLPGLRLQEESFMDKCVQNSARSPYFIKIVFSGVSSIPPSIDITKRKLQIIINIWQGFLSGNNMRIANISLHETELTIPASGTNDYASPTSTFSIP